MITNRHERTSSPGVWLFHSCFQFSSGQDNVTHLLIALALAPRILSAGVFWVPPSIPRCHNLLSPSSLSLICVLAFMFFLQIHHRLLSCHPFCFLPCNVPRHIAYTRLSSYIPPLNSRPDSNLPPPYFELVLCLLYHPPKRQLLSITPRCACVCVCFIHSIHCPSSTVILPCHYYHYPCTFIHLCTSCPS